jgi:hypothetical protein
MSPSFTAGRLRERTLNRIKVTLTRVLGTLMGEYTRTRRKRGK